MSGNKPRFEDEILEAVLEDERAALISELRECAQRDDGPHGSRSRR